MNSASETLALRKQLLLARAGLCRLKIRRELDAVRATVARPARMLAFVSSVAVFARLAGVVVRLFRKS